MQLSKLEIRGFKSFGDKVVINFDEGITGIVGPNGCGKSNVVDAIRWVLGEQKTRNLRSDKMENVIFNGTKNRKAHQMAEVAITFNNTKNLLPTEYSQVTITRRYYRTGDSEYLLNGVTCRLKDITDLFLDTGIGPDSYAIIELRMVDDILNDKDNSRRNLFEEAAGISKFKIRKKQTLKKLDDTDADLARVEDLLFEIEKNLKSLEKQAKQTEKYFQIKTEYKNLSILLAGLTIKKFNENFDVLKRQLEEETNKQIALNTSLSTKEAEIEKIKAAAVAHEKLLSSRQKTLNEHIAKIRAHESEKKIKNERLRYLNDQTLALHEQTEQDRKSNERAEFSIKSLGEEQKSVTKQFDELAKNLDILKTEYEAEKLKTATLQEQASSFNTIFREKQEAVFNLNKTLEFNQIQLSTFKLELDKTASDNHTHTTSLSEFESKINIQQEQIVVKETLLQLQLLKEENLQKQIADLEAEIEKLKEENVITNRKLDSKQNEFNLTKSLVDNLEGFPDAVRFLKKNSQWAKEAPLLSDILTCDDNYRIAIENYLESYMNYYVVEQEKNAIDAVNLLSESSKGKANFFILSAFENFKTTPIQTIPNAKHALELVEFEDKYRALIEYVLNDVYLVTENQEDLPNTEAVLITLNGKIAKKKFSISGGSVGLFEGKRIGRAKNLEKLEEQIKTLTAKQIDIKARLNNKINEQVALKESTFAAEIDTTKKAINTLQNELVSIETRKEQLVNVLHSTASKTEDIQDKIVSLTEEISLHQPKVDEAKQILADTEEQINTVNRDLVAHNEHLAEKSAKYNQENIHFHQQSNKISSLEQEIGYKQAAFEGSKARIEKNTAELRKIEEEIKNMINNAEISDDELVELYKEKEAIEGGLSEAEKEYYNNRGNIDAFEKEAKEIQRQRENVALILVEINNKINEEKIGLTAIKERISVEFEVNVDHKSEEELQTSLTEKELKHKIDLTKNSLERLGPINPMAMEAYNEIKERHTFIATQKDDLINAKKSLMDTIKEIDTVAKATFLEAFHLIRENFIKVFRSLFSDEDSCDLRLADPSHPSESAIEITAKPKGKKPLTINQLSGGEKTLTAISLLFAIYLLKPAPFCIFDEVDAPLDDANIDKFNNIIRKFANESQFIIVTHNKRTMASTDIIYGVTMVEQGVSRVVPVDLRSLE